MLSMCVYGDAVCWYCLNYLTDFAEILRQRYCLIAGYICKVQASWWYRLANQVLCSHVSEWLDGIDCTCRFGSSQVSSPLNPEQFLQMIVPVIIMRRNLLWNNHLKLFLSKECTLKILRTRWTICSNWYCNSPTHQSGLRIIRWLPQGTFENRCSFMVFSSITLVACWYPVFEIEA